MSAVAIVLSAVEYALPDLPIAVPGAKLGLSNIATMFTADTLGLLSAVCVSVLKSLFVLITRGFTAFLMSLCGGLLSTIIMYIMLNIHKHPFGYIGVGVAGAVTHNVTQLMVASLIMGVAVFGYAVYLIPAAIITGGITGLALGIMLPVVKKINIGKLQGGA